MTLRRMAGLVAAAELPLVALVAPALLFPTPQRLWVLALVAIVWIAARAHGGSAVPATPFNTAILALLATVAASAYATFDFRFSLGKTAGIVLGVLVFWALARWLTTARRLQIATAGFVIAGAGLAVIGLLGGQKTYKYPALFAPLAKLPQVIHGVPGAEQGFNANAVAGCLVLFLPLQIAILAGGEHRWLGTGTGRPERRNWTGVALLTQAALLAVTSLGVLLLQSRGAWLALAGSAVVPLVAFAADARRRRPVAIASAILAIAVVAVFRPLATAAITRPGSDLDAQWAERRALWTTAVDGIRDFPLTGMGPNAFRALAPRLYPNLDAPPTADAVHAHNQVLQTALDLGIPGLVAYLAIWLIAAGILISAYRSATDRIHRVLAAGLGTGLAAHFLFGLVDAIPLGAKIGVAFWIAMALAVGIHRAAGAGVQSLKPALTASS